MNLFESIIPGAHVTLAYAERLLKDIPPALSARKPQVNGTTIDCNHPVFIFGHLALYPAIVAQLGGLSNEGVTVPANWAALFQMGVECKDDPKGDMYPGIAEVSESFFSGMRRMIERIPSMTSEKFHEVLENPSRRERFGNVGAFTAYVLLAHPQTHLGQLSVWRRCVGLAAA